MTPKQERFIEEYLVDLNATQAAIRAGYSERTANEQGARLLANASVAAAIEAGKDKRSTATNITAETVMRELYRLATVDVAQAYDEHGNLKAIHDIPEDVRRAIAGVEVVTEKSEEGESSYTKKLKFWDKNKSLELLGKHVNVQAFKDRIEHSGEGGGPVRFIIEN